ncbi:MAG: hypothetical protein KC656_04375 [Myxococcales bacterium]|nr:hypothetical protein [Myxococcales bacterium]
MLSLLVPCFAGDVGALSTLSIPDDAPLDRRALVKVDDQLPEASRFTKAEVLGARWLLPDLALQAPAGMWAWLKEPEDGLPVGTPVLMLVVEGGRVALYIAPNGVRAGSNTAKLTTERPEEVVYPTFEPLDPSKLSASVIRPFAERQEVLAGPLKTWTAELERFKGCAARVRGERVGAGVDPSAWNVVTYDRSGRVTSIRSWAEVVGNEIASTCGAKSLQAADVALTEAGVALWNQQMQDAQEALQARLAPPGPG